MFSQEFTPLDVMLLDNAFYILASAKMIEKNLWVTSLIFKKIF